MSDPTIFGAAAIVVTEAGAAGYVAWRVSGAAVGTHGSRALRMVTGLVVGLTQVIGVQMACLMVDVLYVPVVLSLDLALAFLSWRLVRPAQRKGTPGQPVGGLGIALGAVLSFVGILAVLMSAKIPTDPDSLQYHIPNAAFWLQVHNLWHLPPTNPGFFTNGYPSDGELVTSWIIQPLHQAQWAALPQPIYAMAILAGAALLAEELGGLPLQGLLAATVILITPLSWGSQIDTALTDWISLSGLVMSAGLILHARRHFEWRWVVLAGLALGIGVGSKDTALLPALLIIGLGAFILPPSRRLRACLLMVVGVIVLAGIWFLRDAIQAGNPLYPEPIRIAGKTILRGGQGPVTAWSSSILKDLFTRNASGLKICAESFVLWIGPAILVCAGAALGLVRWKRGGIGPLLASIAAIWFLIYLATPYTGPSSFPLLILSEVRYGLPAITLAAVCACVESRWLRVAAWIAIGYDLWGIWGILHGVHVALIPEVRIQTPRPTFVLVALAGALVVGGFLLGSQRAHLWARMARAAEIASASTAVTLAAGTFAFLSAVAMRHVPAPSQLDIALAAAGRPHGPVMIDGDSDVLAAMGDKLQHRVVSAGGGGAPHQLSPATVAVLDARVKNVDPAAVIVGPTGWPGVFPGWTPPGYRLLYDDGSGHLVYIEDTMFADLSRSK